MIGLEDFRKVDIITARVTGVRDHPDADKLLIVEVDTGEEKKEVVAGIKKYYTKEELAGRDVIIVNNLEPAVIRGVKSSGMILAVETEEGIGIIKPDKPVKPGARIK